MINKENSSAPPNPQNKTNNQELIVQETATLSEIETGTGIKDFVTMPTSVIVSTVPTNGVPKKIAEFSLENSLTNSLLQVEH